MSIHVMDWYWRNSTEKSNALLLLLALADFANEDGECYPGSVKLGKKSRLTKTSLKNILSKLERAGKIGIVQGGGVAYNGGKTNRYYLNEYRQHRKVDDKPAPLPIVLTATLSKRTIKPESLKDKMTLVTRVTPGHASDTPSGHAGDIPPGHASDPKPSLEPSLQPSGSFAPATQDAHSSTPPDSSAVEEKSEAPATPPAPAQERKSSAKKKESAPRARNPVFDALAQHLFGVALDDDAALQAVAPRVGKLLAFAANRVTPDEVPRFMAWYRKHYPKAALPLDSAKFATHWTAYAKARDAYAAQQPPPVLGGMAVDPEKLKQLGWSK